MTHHVHGLPCRLLTHGIHRLVSDGCGICSNADICLENPPQQFFFEPQDAHNEGRDGDGGFFPCGVPIVREQQICDHHGKRWNARLPDGKHPYWTGPIQVSSTGKPEGWRLLHFLEAVSLLVMYPWLQTVRYRCQRTTNGVAVLYFDTNDRCTAQCTTGHTNRAYVQGTSDFLIHEEAL